MAFFISRRGQLQWLALLAVAVVLPTVSLLWFMSRVIANERLVVHQKLTALYQDKLTDAGEKTAALYSNRLATLDKVRLTANPYSSFRRLVLDDNFQGMILWDSEGTVVYPQTSDVMGNDASPDNPLAHAWNLEFANKQYADAAELFEAYVNNANPRIAVAAVVGRSRCLAKLARIPEAIEQCQEAAFHASVGDPDQESRLDIENARLLLLSLLEQAPEPQRYASLFLRTITALAADLYHAAGDRPLLPANQNLFIAQKVLAALNGSFTFADTKLKDQIGRLVAAEDLSISAAETLTPLAGLVDGVFKTTLGGQTVYALRHRVNSSTVLALFSAAGIDAVLSGYRDAFKNSEAAYRILDASGNLVAGKAEPQGAPFTVSALPDGFPSWKVELYFEGGDIFKRAANRQIAVYVWTGALVILMILMAGGFATRAVGRQIRLNEMKNDFIATVSHELKTPLASMRLLVDTMLEGRVRDEAQTKEYLRLTARENERLSRMIDNFLSFSRMERNKKAFTFAEAGPAAIVNDAVESLHTKYAAQHCNLALDVAKDLPDIQADHDAIVTVLVNLLDNACKYTTDNKQISLKAFAQDGFVCFAVSDNGIGLARRHLRKIFESFYQVDRSLARKAEGCGLGLSIVKFIVDAHKGKVAVESRPGQGSTFTVRLPVSRKNGN